MPLAVTARRPVKVVFLVVLVAVLASNLVNLWRNEDNHPHKFGHDSLYAAARTSPYKSVRGGFTVYEFMRMTMAGKRLTIPAMMHGHTWFLQRVSRLEVDFSEALELRIPQFRRLRRSADRVLHLRTLGKLREIYFRLEEGVDHYVVAHNPEKTMMIVMPAAEFEALTQP